MTSLIRCTQLSPRSAKSCSSIAASGGNGTGAHALKTAYAGRHSRSGDAARKLPASIIRRPAPARTSIAMALANEPDLLIAMSRTTALDVTVQAQI